MSTETAAAKPADDFLSGLDASDAEVVVPPEPAAIDPPKETPKLQADATPPAKADTAPPAKADAIPPTDKADHSVAGQNAPTAAMLAERRRLKEEISARDQRLETLEAELKALKAAAAPKETPPPAPDFAENPKGYVDTTVKSQTDRIAALEKQIKEGQDANENARKAQEAYTEALRQVREAETEHMKNAPDYYDALEHSRNVRRSQIQILAPEATADQIEAELTRQELATAFGMLKSGQNPAERAYAYAKTLGYTPKQAAAMAAADAGKSTPATQERTPDGKFKTAPDPAELEARKAAAASLGSGGNEALAAMESEIGTEGDVFDQAKNERFRR